MILDNYKIRRYDTLTEKWDILKLSQLEYLDLLLEKYKLPGEFNFTLEKIKHFTVAKDQFVAKEYYCEEIADTPEYEEWWEEEGMKCVHGVMVDEFFITSTHYFYLNFLKINDKVRKKSYFPDFWDSDVWYFYCRDIAQLKGLDLSIVKKRQWGSSFKLMAGVAQNLWFFRDTVTKIFSTDKSHVLDSWQFLEDYRDFLNEHTNWYREFNPKEKLNWKQQQSVNIQENDGVRDVNKGRKNVVKGITTDKKAFAVVGGKCDEYIAEEAGKNKLLDQSYNACKEAMRFGDIKTGFFIASGAVGELTDADSLKKFTFNPDENGFLSFPNIWSDRPDEKVGMFVPAYYNYGSFTDRAGNSLIQEAKFAIKTELSKTKKEKTIKDYLVQLSQMPETLEDAFGIREENIFPVEIIQPYYEKLLRSYTPIYASLTEEFGRISQVNSNISPISEFPMRKTTDRRGCVCIIEPPISNPPLGVYYAGVDTISEVQTTTSESLQSIYIFRADYYDNDTLVRGQMVAWYTGRYPNSEVTYNISRMLMEYYNALTMVESDNRGYLSWLISKKKTRLLMKQSQYPKLSLLVPNSKIHENYGIRKGSSAAFEGHLLESLINYVKEEIEIEQGESEEKDKIIYGVERIKDVMLLKEMLSYKKKLNVDRIWSFAYALNISEGMANRERIVKVNNQPKEEAWKSNKIQQFTPLKARFNYIT